MTGKAMRRAGAGQKRIVTPETREPERGKRTMVRSRQATHSMSLLAALSALLTGHALAGERLVRSGDRIAIFGDSISTGVKGTYGFVAVELINRKHPELALTALNHGHPGWRADQALKAVDAVLADKPQVVTIMFGTNDLGQKGAKGVAELAGHLQKLIDRFGAAGVRVVLLTTPYTSGDRLWGQSLNEAGLPQMGEDIFALGKKNGLPVFDMYAAMKTAELKARKADPEFMMFGAPGDCHPNGDGHRIMGEALMSFLLGNEVPPHEPFVWRYSGTPSAAAGRIDRPFDLNGATLTFPDSTPMLLEAREQILEPDRWTGPKDLSARALAGWDQRSLFIEVRVKDDIVLPGTKQPAWGHDGIEFFLDVRPEAERSVAYSPGYFQLFVGVVEQDGPTQAYCGAMDTLDADALQAWSSRTEDGYTLRLAVPWSELRSEPTPGDTVGLDYAINDRDEGDKGRHKALWRGAGDDYTNAGATGKLILE